MMETFRQCGSHLWDRSRWSMTRWTIRHPSCGQQQRHPVRSVLEYYRAFEVGIGEKPVLGPEEIILFQDQEAIVRAKKGVPLQDVLRGIIPFERVHQDIIVHAGTDYFFVRSGVIPV